jgi:hypothetical protein
MTLFRKGIWLIGLFSIVITGFAVLASPAPATSCCEGEALATCNPVGICKACKNCKYCKHCSKQGGTCSVCRR